MGGPGCEILPCRPPSPRAAAARTGHRPLPRRPRRSQDARRGQRRITHRLLDAAQPALSAVSKVLVAIARWGGRSRSAEPGSPPKMLMSAASQVLVPLDLADLADLTVPRAAYDPAPPLPAPSRGCATPSSPAASPSAPGPKHAR
ncbi:hypothetical protein GPN2_20963 [Streptomyces murinus]